MRSTAVGDELCIVYENVGNAPQKWHEQQGEDLNARTSRKLELNIIGGKVNESRPLLRKQKLNEPCSKQVQNTKNYDTKQNRKSIGVQTTEGALSFLHGSVKPCKIQDVQTGKSNDVAHALNSTETQIENSDCCIVFDGFQEARETNSGHSVNFLTPAAHSESAKECLKPIKPKTYEEAMQIIRAFESKQLLSICENLDMQEEPLDFQPPYLHELGFSKSEGLSKDDKKNLISQGIHIRGGRFSKKEDKIIMRNWNNFVQKHNIDNPALLLGLYRGQGKKTKEIVAFRHAKKFSLQLSKDLNDRTLKSVCFRARNILDRWNYKGRFSVEELEEVFRLQRLMGNQWSSIAILMNRRGQVCNNVYRRYKSKPSKGAWSEKEDNLLCKAVRRFVVGKKLRTKLCGYPWTKISNLVPNRNEWQCRAHWLTSLCWKYTRREQYNWKKRNAALLVYVMYVDMVEDQSFVDWDYLHKIFEDCAPSPLFLQNRWSDLKRKVPEFLNKDHESIVLYLYRNYLPELFKKLGITEQDLECIRKQKIQGMITGSMGKEVP